MRRRRGRPRAQCYRPLSDERLTPAGEAGDRPAFAVPPLCQARHGGHGSEPPVQRATPRREPRPDPLLDSGSAVDSREPRLAGTGRGLPSTGSGSTLPIPARRATSPDDPWRIAWPHRAPGRRRLTGPPASPRASAAGSAPLSGLSPAVALHALGRPAAVRSTERCLPPAGVSDSPRVAGQGAEGSSEGSPANPLSSRRSGAGASSPTAIQPPSTVGDVEPDRGEYCRPNTQPARCRVDNDPPRGAWSPDRRDVRRSPALGSPLRPPPALVGHPRPQPYRFTCTSPRRVSAS